MKRIYLLICIFCSLFFYGPAQIPAGYYDDAAGKNGEDLQSALHVIIQGHTVSTYTPGVWNAFHTTDVKPDETVWDMYSDIPDGTPNGRPPYVYQMGTDQCGNAVHEGDCYSREHSFPKSWFGGEVYPMFTDLFHIYPTDQYVNGRRSDNPYGEVGNATWTSENGSQLGTCTTPGYSGTVFEPLDDYKGDLARTYFYMATRYEDIIGTWQNIIQGGVPILDGTSFPVFQTWYLNMILRWSSQDPVSQKEIDRNNAIYLIQHNRNPFIDHPEYANLIWGNPFGIPVETVDPLIVFPNPAKEKVFIRLPNGVNITNSEIMLISVTGKQIHPGMTVEERRISLDLQTVSEGAYFILLMDKKSAVTYRAKLMKE